MEDQSTRRKGRRSGQSEILNQYHRRKSRTRRKTHLERDIPLIPRLVRQLRVNVLEPLLLLLLLLGLLELGKDVGGAVFGEGLVEVLDTVCVVALTDVGGANTAESPARGEGGGAEEEKQYRKKKREEIKESAFDPSLVSSPTLFAAPSSPRDPPRLMERKERRTWRAT